MQTAAMRSTRARKAGIVEHARVGRARSCARREARGRGTRRRRTAAANRAVIAAGGRRPHPGQPASSIEKASWRTISEVLMATVGRDLKSVELTGRELWQDGPPLELFKELRRGCPIHWTESFEELPEEAGFWSVTTADDIHAVSRDWQTYSSELGGVVVAAAGFPIELARAMFIGMDPPKHDRLKALFQAGFTPKRIAAHGDAIRAIVVDVFDRLKGRETCELVNDVAQPAVSRVIGSFMGIPPEDDDVWANLMTKTLGAADPDLNPDGFEGAVEKDVPRSSSAAASSSPSAASTPPTI